MKKMKIKSISINVNTGKEPVLLNGDFPVNINITIENHFDKPVGAVVNPGVDEQTIKFRKDVNCL